MCKCGHPQSEHWYAHNGLGGIKWHFCMVQVPKNGDDSEFISCGCHSYVEEGMNDPMDKAKGEWKKFLATDPLANAGRDEPEPPIDLTVSEEDKKRAEKLSDDLFGKS